MNNLKITKVQKDSDGDITNVLLSDGSIHTINEAIEMTKSGLIQGVNVSISKNNKEYLRSNPNNTSDDNLDNLELF